MRYIYLRYPGGRAKAVTLSYDDGCQTDARMAKTLTAHGMKGTFNLNGSTLHAPSFRLEDEKIKELILGAGHEIAVHGYLHRAPGSISATAGIRDVLDCRTELESRFGRIVRGMAYPDLGVNMFANGLDAAHVERYLADLGIVYARVTQTSDDFRLPENFLCWKPTAHHNNAALFELVDQFLSVDFSKIYSAHRYPRLFYLWGHSYEFDRNDNWNRIEQFCDAVGGREDIWYATNIEIYEYVSAFRSLVFSADEHLVCNPTLYDICMDVDGRAVTVPSGQTVTL